MNKNEAKTIKPNSVVIEKKTGEELVVTKVAETEKDKFEITVENGNVYKHADLQYTGKEKSVTKTNRFGKSSASDWRKSRIVVTTGEKMTQELHDSLNITAKTGIHIIGGSIKRNENGDFVYRVVGSSDIVTIKAASLYQAKVIVNKEFANG